jgi:hypothetical protein
MARVKATFYLPLADNDGRSLSGEISEVEDRCYAAFGAWTAAGFFKGAWRMKTGHIKVDTSGVYVVSIDDARVEELVDILKAFKAQTSQEAIYLEIERKADLRFV